MTVPNTFIPGTVISAAQVNQNFNAVVDTSTLAASSGSSGVGFLQSGTGATARTAQAKMRDTVSVKDFGAVGNGVADDTAAIVAACAASNSIDFPAGTYKITSTIEPGANKFLNFSNVTILSSVAGPAFLIRGNTDVVTFSGDVLIDCQNTAGSVGLKIQATSAIASPATTNTFDQLFVRQADIGVHLYSDGNQGIYYNDFYRVQVLDSTKGIFLETASGGASQREVNANHFGMVTLQRCVDALTLDGTWGNYFDFLEAESNTGIAINLVDAFSVGINGGWIEGNTTNLSIGNVPNVYGVYIKASIDSALDSADTKFVYTPSDERSVIIENSQFAKWFGRAAFEERVDIGDYGVAANDQGNAPDSLGRLRVTASQDFFRLSAGNPLFFMRARTGTEGWYFGLDNGSTRLFDLQRSRAVLDTRLALANSAWDKNQLTLGSYYLWLDATGVLRIKSGAPVNDTDGNAVVYAATLAASSGSSGVGFLQSGTGAVARTVQSKLRDTVSPKDFGAVGNGATNDYAALQAAANTGLPINLDGASYFTTSTITITSDIIGPGEITGDATGGAVILIAVDADNVTLRDVTLTGNSANAAASANVAVSAENQSWLTLQNCTIKNGRIRHRNTQLSYQYGLRIENCDIDCDFTLNDYVVTQNDIITVRGINGVWIENNNITFTNCHRVAKLADTEGWVSGQVTAYRTRNVSFSGNTITGSTGSNKQVFDMFTGVSDAVLSDNNITVTGFSRVIENKTDSIAQPWNQNITVANNHLSNDSLVLNFAGTYGDSDPTVDVGWQNLTIIGNTIICTAAAAATAVIIRWQHDLVFTNNQIIAPAANALTTGGNAVQIYGNRFCTFNSNTVKYGNVFFSTISTGADRTHAPIMLSISASNNTVEEFGSTASTTGRGGLVFSSMATAETANLSVNVNGNSFYKSTSPVLSNAGAVAFITCTIAEVLVTSNNAKFATASEERVIILTSTITQFGAENNSWDFYGTAASASTVTLPGGQVVEITGTSNISTITAADNAGRRVSLVFRDVLTVNDGSNLKLAGNFTTSADDTLSLVCDGTNWYETSRSAN